MYFDDDGIYNVDPNTPLYECLNCGAGIDECLPSPSGYGCCCSQECVDALKEFLAEAHRPRVRSLDYATKDDCPF